MKLLNLLGLTDLQWCSFAPACNALFHQKVRFLEKNCDQERPTNDHNDEDGKSMIFLEQLKQTKEQIPCLCISNNTSCYQFLTIYSFSQGRDKYNFKNKEQ